MALIRAEIRNRLGSSSIYDGIVEFQSDFENEPMLDSVHYGSMMICLNYDVNDGGDAAASDLYVKREDGSWDRVVTITAGMDGKSAYDVAVENGFDGTEEEWLASLTGNDGTTFTPSVSQSGVLSWTNDGGKQNPQSVDLTAALASSGAVAPLFVVFSKNNYGVWEADKTIAEIASAYNARRPVFFQYGENASEAVHIVDGADNYYVAQMVCSENSTINHYKFFVYNGYGATASVQEIGGVTPEDIISATGQMTAAQAAQTRDNLNAAPAETVQTVSGTDPTITPVANTIYKCGELTSLTITDPPSAGAYAIIFTSGSTATSTTIPATILGLEDFAAEANTMYEINVLDNRAVVGSWKVSST